jgi:hypothetical protein
MRQFHGGAIAPPASMLATRMFVVQLSVMAL